MSVPYTTMMRCVGDPPTQVNYGTRCCPLSRSRPRRQTFGDKACHPERSEGSLRPANEILSAAKDDSQGPSQGRSREAYLLMSTAAGCIKEMLAGTGNGGAPLIALVLHQLGDWRNQWRPSI